MANALAHATSPYLQQHRENPVDWREWSPEAFAEARRQNKPVLLSVGYAACHWCHVMAHESFEDPQMAELMNRLFVNIKLDREERPDLDLIYQTALAAMGGHGGWPLTMFLLPDGTPFYGATYIPKEPRFGMPGFDQVLESIANAYHSQAEAVQQNADQLRGAIRQSVANQPGPALPSDILEAAAERLIEAVDWTHGGLGQAPKFPQPAALDLLWRVALRNEDARAREAVRLSLRRMCQGGIYDHLGGGFARYAVEETWTVPHFEKMLYDNAQLIRLLTHAWQETREGLFAQRVQETIAWLLREMRVEARDGATAFASSLDADSPGPDGTSQEGAYYVWSAEEIDRLLGDEAERVKAHYDVSPEGNWEGKTILHRNHGAELAEEPPAPDRETEERLAEARQRLFEAREARPRPGRDDKVLADWNGMLIAALAFAGRVFEREEWIAAARGAFAFITRHLDAGQGRLYHAWRGERAAHVAGLDDYAWMAQAALQLYQLSGDEHDLAWARRWIAVADAHFWDHESGGYAMTADDGPDTRDLVARPKTAMDSAIPAGNGVMAKVLGEIFHLTGETAYAQRADALLRAFSGQVNERGLGMTSLLSALDVAERGQAVVLLETAPGQAGPLARAADSLSLPNRLMLPAGDGTGLDAEHPAAGKTVPEGASAAACVCTALSCSLALTSAAALDAHLRETRVRAKDSPASP